MNDVEKCFEEGLLKGFGREMEDELLVLALHETGKRRFRGPKTNLGYIEAGRLLGGLRGKVK